jgi:hypothetical protein
VLKACRAVPLHCSEAGKRCVIGFIDRVEHGLLRALEEVTEMRAEPCFVTRAQMAEQSARLRRAAACDEIVWEGSESPAQMANTTGRFAVEVGARSARFTRCRDLVWTRLTGKRRKIDLLFRVCGAAARQPALLNADQDASRAG